MQIRFSSLKPGTLATYRSAFNAHLYAAFETRRVESISLGEWIDFFDGIAAKSKVTAGTIPKQLKTVLNWCIRRQMITTMHVLQLRIADIGETSAVGRRVLTLVECGKIWRELDKSRATPSVINSIKCCMLTGARVSELLNAKRTDFDLDSMLWTVPVSNSKTNLPIRRPISPMLLDILQQQWRLYRSEWCFPAPNDHSRPVGIASVYKFVRYVRDSVDIPHWRLHDFRRTLSTRLSENGVLPHFTEKKMLGHVLGGVMVVYNKHDWLDEQSKAYEVWTVKVMLASSGDSSVEFLREATA